MLLDPKIQSGKFFFSPQPGLETTNNYIINFFEALAKRVNVINYHKKPLSRSLDFLRYTFSSDVMILNWPEDVIHLRYGLMQIVLTFISLTLFRICGGKIIWVCHNKKSHVKKHLYLAKFARYFFIQFAQIIIVHSEDAIKQFSKKSKVFFINHPVYFGCNLKVANKIDEKIDVLIWGNITPYKGLNEFVESYRQYNATFNVTIIGKADKDYFKIINENAKGLNIIIEDKFLTDVELSIYFKNSKIILLPYLDTDTFSSGSLIHSLNSKKVVIGPAIGNFLDIHKWGAGLIYNNYAELFKTIANLLENQYYYDEILENLNNGINNYYKENTWEEFIEQILKLLTVYKTKKTLLL